MLNFDVYLNHLKIMSVNIADASRLNWIRWTEWKIKIEGIFKIIS